MSEQCSMLEGNKCYRKQKKQSRTQGLGNAEGRESTSHEREGLLSKKKLRLDGLSDSQPLQMANGAKTKKWLLSRDQIQDTAGKT